MTSSQRPLAKRYKLLRQLAAGSYAETWLANDLMLDRHVAIKLLHPSEGDPGAETERFLREARIAAAVSHPNIVAVFDAGSKGDRPFLVMEWVDGVSLKQQILKSRRMSIERAIEITADLLDGLSSIHEQGIIHRDVKPQNIMLNEFGTAKLTDFGIARLISEAETRSDGTTAGSAAYMAPEQAQGHPLSPAADIYATGVILFEMLTGRLPFRHEDPQRVMLQHISDPVPRPRRINPGIPIELESIVLQALSKDPLNRYQSADEMRSALISVRRKLPVRRPVQLQPFEEPSPFAFPRFAWMAASITLIFVMLAGATSLAVRDSDVSQNVAESTEVTETATSTPVVTVEEPEPNSAPTEVPTTTERDLEFEREMARWDDDSIIRGEIVIEGAPQPPIGVNRPAPSGEASSDDDDEDIEQEVASTNNQPAWEPSNQQSSPEPAAEEEVEQEAPVEATPEPEPSEDEQSDAVTDDDDAEESESDSEESGNPEGVPEQEAENESDGNGDSNADEGQQNGADREVDDEDAPAANQAQEEENEDDDRDSESDSTAEHQNGDERDRASEEDDDSTVEHQDVASNEDDSDGSDRSNQNRSTSAVAIQQHRDANADDTVQSEGTQDRDTNGSNSQRQDASSDEDDDEDSNQNSRNQNRSTSNDDEDEDDKVQNNRTQNRSTSSDDDDEDEDSNQNSRTQNPSTNNDDKDEKDKQDVNSEADRRTVDNEKRNTDRNEKNNRSDEDEGEDGDDNRIRTIFAVDSSNLSRPS